LGLVEAAFGKSPGVVLAAGPGYGKTSLAAEMGGVYLALAEEAKDPAVFLWHLLYAYRDRAGLSEAARLLEGGAWPRALEALLEALEPLGPQLLVLDEAHRAESPGVLKALEGLCRLPSLRLLLLSRKAAPFAFLTVLTEQELAFDPEEAWALAKALAPELPAFEVERAHSLVRGWPLGLRVVLLAMRRGLRPELALESGEGLLTYLAYGLPQELLLKAARLALLGEVPEEEAQDLLPYAEDLLLERRPGRLAFHPLVRSALKALLPEAEARELLAQAAETALHQGEGVGRRSSCWRPGASATPPTSSSRKGRPGLPGASPTRFSGSSPTCPRGRGGDGRGYSSSRPRPCARRGRYREAEAAYQRALEAGEDRAYLGLVRLFLDTVEPARARPTWRRP
jgi:LuxR family transcriptional regulator, maltose regulon positive regulatory protein